MTSNNNTISRLDKDDCQILEQFTYNTNKFSLNGYKTYAKCVHVYDGDTIHIVFKMPNSSECYKWVIRIIGIDTPEIRTKNLYEKQLGFQARDFLRELILNKIIIVDCLDFDKYGRLLGDLYIEGNELSISKQMIEKGYAKLYDGGTKSKWIKPEF
jgi:micrococcal nuclease|tara:strand:+ start:41 stop:508 length:468 start_codon:yes stop_codon:yes gene_type:complete